MLNTTLLRLLADGDAIEESENLINDLEVDEVVGAEDE
jgi:hypothetical protein